MKLLLITVFVALLTTQILAGPLASSLLNYLEERDEKYQLLETLLQRDNNENFGYDGYLKQIKRGLVAKYKRKCGACKNENTGIECTRIQAYCKSKFKIEF
ncbi:DgyrCDS14955 [Dimorphilus gyrociliatus]|uniref:DgyrCDS14955 n=1 Tax=Dimorphilus gyrociliatus TaxID=2664684 RepID=A0A7I8WFJ0_9ANNE|nr:DgyrCDS14955 [Dimorphilus gyrociliatus]